jgi:hypothetical protein
MTTEQKLKLENAIDKWLEDITKDDSSDIWLPEDLTIRMVEAAELIWDQNKTTQEWLIREGILKET